MNWYLMAWKKYFQFSERSRRKEYWFFFLFNILIAIALGVVDSLTGTFAPETGAGLLGSIYGLAILIPSIALGVRRLHDTDRRGWWLLIGLVPLIGIIVLFVFMVMDGTLGNNRFGKNPKGA